MQFFSIISNAVHKVRKNFFTTVSRELDIIAYSLGIISEEKFKYNEYHKRKGCSAQDILQQSIKSSDKGLINFLLDKNTGINLDVNQANSDNITPLGLATLFNRTEIAIKLIEAGADIHQEYSSHSSKRTPLYNIIMWKNKKILNAALERDLRLPSLLASCEQFTMDGQFFIKTVVEEFLKKKNADLISKKGSLSKLSRDVIHSNILNFLHNSDIINIGNMLESIDQNNQEVSIGEPSIVRGIDTEDSQNKTFMGMVIKDIFNKLPLPQSQAVASAAERDQQQTIPHSRFYCPVQAKLNDSAEWEQHVAMHNGDKAKAGAMIAR